MIAGVSVIVAHHEVLLLAEYGLLASGAALFSLRSWRRRLPPSFRSKTKPPADEVD